MGRPSGGTDKRERFGEPTRERAHLCMGSKHKVASARFAGREDSDSGCIDDLVGRAVIDAAATRHDDRDPLADKVRRD
jgi:hypothetical protein